MKKVYQFIAAASLSVLTIGAFAQHAPMRMRTPLNQRPSKATAKKMAVLNEAAKTHKTTTVLTYYDVAYFNTDFTTFTSSGFTTWGISGGGMNMRYTAADSTGNGPNANYNGYQSAIVAFDTIEDANSNVYVPKAGSVNVDSVFMTLGYHNTSGMNDTLIVIVGSVTSKGYPSTGVYSQDTIVVPPHSTALPGNTVDSLYTVYINPNHGTFTHIPATAPAGYHFQVTVQVYGSKNDTLAVFYGSPYYTCTPYDGVYRTLCGPAFGAAANVNSFMTGFLYYNTAAFGGNGKVLTWPGTTGRLYNSANTFGDYWFTTTCSPDTSYPYFQDNYIMVTIDTDAPLAVNNLVAEKFTIGQNYPNPFNGQTSITYSLDRASDVEFTVHDMTGRVLVNENYSTVSAGQHVITLDANKFAPGIYFYTFNVNGNLATRKMIITQ